MTVFLVYLKVFLYCAGLSELMMINTRPMVFIVFPFAVIFAMGMNAAGILLPVSFDFSRPF